MIGSTAKSNEGAPRGRSVTTALLTVLLAAGACGDSGVAPPDPPAPPPPPPPAPRLLTLERIAVQALDTTVLLPVNPDVSWVFEVAESRWTPAVGVARARRADDASGILAEITGPGTLRIDVWVPGHERESAVIEVRPPNTIVYDIQQAAWPANDDVHVLGYLMDRITANQITLNDQPVRGVTADSARLVVQLPPVTGEGEGCSVATAGEATFAISGVVTATGAAPLATVNRVATVPTVDLAVGESHRPADVPAVCLRIEPHAGAEYILAAVDRSLADAALHAAEHVAYGGGAPYMISFADSANAGAHHPPFPPEPALEREDDLRAQTPAITFEPPRAMTSSEARLAGPDHPVYSNQALTVGDTITWHTLNNRTGTFRVVALYEPNIAFLVFEADMPAIWNTRRAGEIDGIFEALADAQDLYEANFGSEPAVTNPNTGQMFVFFHDGEAGQSTGVTIHNIGDDLRNSTVHIRRHPGWDSPDWYHHLIAHELAHAWQFRNITRFSAIWGTEGIAHWVAHEELRQWAGEPLDANLSNSARLRNYALDLPSDGNFNYGYRESYAFIRFLVGRLMWQHDQSYAEAANRVVTGVAEGWHGHHHLLWGAWGRTGIGPGLTGRMREVIPGWDPVEARLDWTLSLALDDRAGIPEYDFPYVSSTGFVYQPAWSMTVGRGRSRTFQAYRGGNFYIEMRDPDGTGGIITLRAISGGGAPAWKLVRHR